MVALLVVYRVVSARFSTRAGVLSALVLASTPYFAFLTHQAITDMYLVASVTVAVMLLLRAAEEDPDREVTTFRVFGLSLSAQHVVIALVVCLALPQVLYLASRNVTLIEGFLFAWHGDDFYAGSADNGDVPGNAQIRLRHPAIRVLWAQPMAQALLWFACLVLLIRSLRHERRAQALQMYGFYIACALAFMGKGLPGIALPGLVALLYLLACGRWRLLLEGRLRVGQGIGVIACIALPWFVAMYCRHGQGFIDRILIHDHINRLTKGVHGDNGNIQYFLEQLGTGFFPWIALVPAALVVWLRGVDAPVDAPVDAARRRVATALGLWFLATFTLFSAMTTKFHHYIFPAVPPAAILVALALDRMLGPAEAIGREGEAGPWRRTLAIALGALSAVPLAFGFGGVFGDLRGVIPASASDELRNVWVFQHRWPLLLSVLSLVVATGLLWASLRLRGRPHTSRPRSEEMLLRAALLAGAVLVALAGRDLSWVTSVRPVGNERLAHLFIYNYERPWPEELDYRALLSGFACAAALLTGLAALTRLRPAVVQALVGLGLLFGVFCLDVYMIDATPHWTQGHLVRRYYQRRRGPHEPLLAWQMNWKGENYYTGNRVYVFQDLDNKKIRAWLKKNEGTRAFFIFEHKRLGRFKRLMKPREVKTLTTKRDCNKFVLAEADI